MCIRDRLDYKPFETWDEEGGRDTYTLAAARVKTMLENYQKPSMDPAVNEALHAYVAHKKASMSDSFT